MDATNFYPNHPTPADEDQQLRAKFDALALQIAALEKSYRDLGLLFFCLPQDQREDYLGAAAQHIFETAFLPQLDGDVPELAKALTALRPLLDPIKKHLHCLRFAHVREAEAAAARQKLGQAREALDQADRLLAPPRDSIPGPLAREPGGSEFKDVLPLMLMLHVLAPAPALPADEGDGRWAEFKRWALTVREVQNAIELGSGNDKAVASLTVRTAFEEERQVFDRLAGGADAEDEEGGVSVAAGEEDYFVHDADEEDSGAAFPFATGEEDAFPDYHFEGEDNVDDAESDVTNPYEDPIEDVPLHVLQAGLQRPGAPPPAVQLR